MKTGFTRVKCPRCGGNIFLDRDSDGWYQQCLQCGCIWYLETVVEVHNEPAKVTSGRLGRVPELQK